MRNQDTRSLKARTFNAKTQDLGSKRQEEGGRKLKRRAIIQKPETVFKEKNCVLDPLLELTLTLPYR
jgi:hypothetical protein